MEVEEDFYLTLKSNSALAYSGSIPGNFRIKLKNLIDLSHGKWKVALINFKYNRGYINITDINKRVLPNNIKSTAKIEIYHVNNYPSPTNQNELHPDVNCKFDHNRQNIIKLELTDRYRAEHPQSTDNVRANLTCIELEPNFYVSPGDIAEDIVFHFKNARKSILSKNMPLNMEYDNKTGIVKINGAGAIVFEDSNDLIKALGLTSGVAFVEGRKRIIDNSHWKFTGDLYGIDGLLPDSVDLFHVTSEMLEFSRVNSERIQLLGSIPIKIVEGERIEYVPINPEFYRIKDKILNNIDIQISDSLLKPLNLDKGATEINLHFKKYLSI